MDSEGVRREPAAVRRQTGRLLRALSVHRETHFSTEKYSFSERTLLSAEEVMWW